jgi:Thiol-disulfide isomerase and thioredoxins
MLMCIVSTCIGQGSIPSIILSNEKGAELDLSTMVTRGAPTIVTLWATWCGPCKIELNALKKVSKKWKSKYNAEVITVSVDNPKLLHKALKMRDDNNWDFTFLHDSDMKLLNMLEVRGIPMTLLVNGDGEIVSKQIGYSTDYVKKFESALQLL